MEKDDSQAASWCPKWRQTNNTNEVNICFRPSNFAVLIALIIAAHIANADVVNGDEMGKCIAKCMHGNPNIVDECQGIPSCREQRLQRCEEKCRCNHLDKKPKWPTWNTGPEQHTDCGSRKFQ